MQPNWPLASDLSIDNLIMVIVRLEVAETRPITPVLFPTQPGFKLLRWGEERAFGSGEQQLFFYSYEIQRQTFLIPVVIRT